MEVSVANPSEITGLFAALRSRFLFLIKELAEREGFEPPIQLPVCRISSAVLSTTQPPLHVELSGEFALAQGAEPNQALPITTPAVSEGGQISRLYLLRTHCLPSRHEYSARPRRGGRVVEGARLESVYTGNRIAGSNPAPSAKKHRKAFMYQRLAPQVGWSALPSV